MLKKIVRGFCGLVAVCLLVGGALVYVMGPRLIRWPWRLLFAFGVVIVASQFATFAVTGISPFRADQLRELREQRAARRTRANL